MPRVLLAIDDIGLVMPLQGGIEAGGHQVTWRKEAVDGPDVEPLDVDVVVLGIGTRPLREVVEAYRALDPVPAVVAVGEDATHAQAAQLAKTPFVAASAPPEAIQNAIKHALAHRYAFGLSLAFARGALAIDALGSREDQRLAVIRNCANADIALVQVALRWHASHYVTINDGLAALRDARALHVPQLELTELCDGSRTLQTIVRAGKLSPPDGARLLWALACIDVARFSRDPPDADNRQRRAVLEARRHILARRGRLDSSTFYDVLEVGPDAPIEEVERAVQLLAQRYHPQVMDALDLSEYQPLASHLWNQILKARATMIDWPSRGRYGDWLADHEEEIKTTWADETGDLERGEECFSRGQQALVEGDAHAALSQFAAAARACPGHPDYECSLLWARFRSEITRRKDRAESAAANRAEAETFCYGYRPWPRALVALALLCAADGDSGAARWHVREALQVDPKLPAARQLWSRLGNEA